MKTSLLEISNRDNSIIRGIISQWNNIPQQIVICLHWFERCSSTEKKFKSLSDNLLDYNIMSIRLDFSWCWLSDWDFRFTTIDNQSDELLKVLQYIDTNFNNIPITIIAHSLWACVVAHIIDDIKSQIKKFVFISPALNQKNLLRYWFVSSQMKKVDQNINITRENYQQYLDEQAFIEDCKKEDKITKYNYILPEYFLSNKDKDYSSNFENIKDKILHIHWNKDKSVPLESLNIKFNHQIIVEDGDHDMEKPNQIKQWKEWVIKFILQ